MTAYSKISRGQRRTARNKKDGGRRPRSQMKQYETAGFTLIQPPASYSYTWQGVFPIFRVAPGTVQGLAGMVARCEAANIIEWFPYGTDPQVIKKRLDEIIPDIIDAWMVT